MSLDKIGKKSLATPHEPEVKEGQQNISGTMQGQEVVRQIVDLTDVIESTEKKCIPEEILEQPKSEGLEQSVETIMKSNPEKANVGALSDLTDASVRIEEAVQEEEIEIKQEKPSVQEAVEIEVEAEKISEEKLKYNREIEELKKQAGEIDKKFGNSKISKLLEIICRQSLDDNTISKIKAILTRLNKLDQLPKDSVPVKELIEILIKPLDERIKEIKDTRQTSDWCQSVSEIVIGERAKFIASILINDEGKINTELIDIIKNEICSKHSISKKHNEVLRKILDVIKSDELVSLLENLKKPNSDPNIQAVVRSTLGLKPETELTELHSKQAVLSAMLADIRQGEMGSCFATAVAIKMHDQNPKQVAEELKQIIETGRFVKEVDGKMQTFHVPKIYIPTEFGEGIAFTTENIENILKTPGVKKVVEMLGLDIAKLQFQNELRVILRKLIKENPKNLTAIFSGLIHELALKKSELTSDDILHVKDVNDVHEELRALKQNLAPGKYTEIQEALAIKDDAAREEALKPLKEELGEETVATIKRLSDRINVLSPAVPKNYDNMIKEHEKFKQQLELNFMAAGGENSLLRSWEYSVAAYGNADDKKMMVYFQDLFEQEKIEQTLLEWLWEKICNLIGIEVEAQTEGAAERIGISGILNKVLDQESPRYSPFQNYDRDEFRKAFSKNFEERLSKRLMTKFEEGVFKLYDLSRASDVGLATPLDNPKDIQGAIASIAYQAAEDCIKVDENAPRFERAQQRLAKIHNDIGRKLEQEIWKENFLQDLMKAYIEKRGISEDIETNNPELEKHFRRGFEGGRSERVFGAYIGKTLKEVQFSNEPSEFIKEMVRNLSPMIENKSLNIDGESEIMFLMDASKHNFLMRPDSKMLKEVIGAEDVDAWINQKLINEKQIFVIADLNWVSHGQHLNLAIKYKKGEKGQEGSLEFVCVNEKNIETPLPASDANHKFGDSGFIVMFDV